MRGDRVIGQSLAQEERKSVTFKIVLIKANRSEWLKVCGWRIENDHGTSIMKVFQNNAHWAVKRYPKGFDAFPGLTASACPA
jgi:hypothetical protein